MTVKTFVFLHGKSSSIFWIDMSRPRGRQNVAQQRSVYSDSSCTRLLLHKCEIHCYWKFVGNRDKLIGELLTTVYISALKYVFSWDDELNVKHNWPEFRRVTLQSYLCSGHALNSLFHILMLWKTLKYLLSERIFARTWQFL